MKQRIMITGITGTLGCSLSRILLAEGHEVLGISRDEQKQRQMPVHKKMLLRLADVRDGPAVNRLADFYRPDVIYHLAALKCVDTLEFHPLEAIQTNVMGTQNMLDIARGYGIKLVFTSTDKAVYPVNSYGVSKAMAERLVLAAKHTVVRYGNVLGSRGSFLPNLILSLKTEGMAYVTDPAMTRFWMSVDQAAKFVMEASNHDGLRVPVGIQATNLLHFVAAVATFCGVEKYEVKEIGARPGEKIHESLMTAEEGEHISSCDKALQFDPRTLVKFITNVMTGDI